MAVSTTPLGRRTDAFRVALSVILSTLCLAQMGCQQLSPEQQRTLDEYRRSNVGPGAGTM
jgi:hypothetical protein